MQSMNQSLEKLITSRVITEEEGLKASSNPSDLKIRLGGFAQDQGFELVGQKKN
jgi:Tfp pilus assembly ATPase PilU